MSDWQSPTPQWQPPGAPQGAQPGPYPPSQPGGRYGVGPYGAPPFQHSARASFFQRFGGTVIDGLLASAVMLVAAVPLVAIGAVLIKTEPSTCTNTTTGLRQPCDVPTSGSIALLIFLMLIFFLVYLAIIFFLLIRPVATTGQTVGRRAMNIKVVDLHSGQPLSTGKATVRYLFAAVISGFCYIGYLWMLWDDNSQTLHDKVTDAVVIPA